jgi:parallel beta-helix repeat protein
MHPNSTIANNRAQAFSGAGKAGGISDESGGVLTVNNSTISGNSAFGQGGGILLSGSSRMAARDTIIAENIASAGSDVYGNLGSQGHNLIGNPQDMTGWVSSDLLHVNPMLGPLADNGGPTLTTALLPGSPAIDAGDNTAAPMWDQRGAPFRRIVNGVIDIGAFEVQARGHGGATHQPLPDPVPVQVLGTPFGTLLGQPPGLPADPSPLPEPGLLDGQAGPSGPVTVPTATGQQAPATSFGTYPATEQPVASLGSLSASDLDALALNLLGGP